MIDLYCERIGPEFWAEPLNALSNLAFLLAFAFILPMVKRQWCVLTGPAKAVTVGLLALLLAIFVGSSAFHTLATRQALLADVIPVSLFQLVFLAGYQGPVDTNSTPLLEATRPGSFLRSTRRRERDVAGLHERLVTTLSVKMAPALRVETENSPLVVAYRLFGPTKLRGSRRSAAPLAWTIF